MLHDVTYHRASSLMGLTSVTNSLDSTSWTWTLHTYKQLVTVQQTMTFRLNWVQALTIHDVYHNITVILCTMRNECIDSPGLGNDG
jgi:hypothetical protein